MPSIDAPEPALSLTDRPSTTAPGAQQPPAPRQLSPRVLAILAPTLLALAAGCTPATPTATPPPTTSPTATVTPTPSITPSPTATSTPTFPADAIVQAGGLSLRAGPNTLHPVRDVLRRGTPVAIEGRSHDDQWLAVRAPSEARGWLSADYLQLRRELSTVPTQPTPTSPPTPTATAIPMDPAQPLVLVPPVVAQGEPLLVRLRAPGAQQVIATLDRVELSLQRVDGERFAAVVPAHRDIAPGQQPVYLTVVRPDGSSEALSQMLSIRSGGYADEAITLDVEANPELLSSIDPEVRAAEVQRLSEVWSALTAERLWSGAWTSPITMSVSSPFGTRRVYNEGLLEGRHSGLDLRAPFGTTVRAPARGRVVLVEELAVLGLAVWLDHGWGVYSGYGHLQAATVEPGAVVERGTPLGLVGASGSATGPHLHWEVRVTGEAVHPLRFTERDVGAVP